MEPIANKTAVVRRQKIDQGCNKVFRVRGEYVDVEDLEDVEIIAGPIVEAWWEVPLPPCPDCGGELAWGEAGSVPAARCCTRCGSLFTVQTR